MARAHRINREASARGGRKVGPITGPVQGRKNAEKPGHMSDIGDIGRHVRWHLKRGMTKPDCAHCGA